MNLPAQRTHADRGHDQPTKGSQDAGTPGRSSSSATLMKPEQASASGIVKAPVVDEAIGAAVETRATQLATFVDQQHAMAEAGERSAEPLSTRGGAAQATPATTAAAPAATPVLDTKTPAAPPEPGMPTKVVQHAGSPVATAPETTKALAQQGVQQGGGALPHADQIQASFGRHDVSGIRAHMGGAAEQATAQMGARAFAMGNDVAFRGSADVHTAAHEAAHVVQQRKGASPSGGVGRDGDAYERHADQVADAVTRGESAEHILDVIPDGGAAAEAVQLDMDVTPPSSLIGADIAEPYAALPALASMPVTEGATGVTAEPVAKARPQTSDMKTFFGKARGLDSTMLTNINDVRMIIDVNIAMKGAAIDKALTADKASGVVLDPGLETAINVYKKAAADAKAGVLQLVGFRTQIEGISDGIAAEAAIAKTEQDKKDAQDQKSAEAKADADKIAKSRREAKMWADAAIDTVRIATKVMIDPKGAVNGIIDEAGVAAKVGFQTYNDGQQEQEIAASKARIEQKYQATFDKINAANAEAVAKKVAAAHTQIEGIKTTAKGVRDQTVAAMKLATEQMATIMKAKSKVTALAPIQDFITTLTAKAGDMNKRLAIARPSFAWDFAGTGSQVKAQIDCDISDGEMAYSHWMSRKAKNLPSSMLTADGFAKKDAEFTTWLKQAKALSGWVGSTQAWFTKNSAELTTQADFVSGPHLDKAEKALAAIADLGEGGK